MPPPARWSTPGLLATALGAFAAAVAVSLVAIFPLGVLRVPAEQLSPYDVFILALASDGALLVALFLLGRRLLGLRPADLGFRRPTRDALRLAALAAVALWALAIGLNAIQTLVFGAHPQALVVTVSGHSGPLALLLDLATGALVAPIAEETLFRGLLFAGLAQRMPFRAAAGISAFLFAISHGPAVLVPIFVLGLGLAWLYARTRTIWAPVAAHAIVNTISLVLVFVAPR